jgi:hypothetical protein
MTITGITMMITENSSLVYGNNYILSVHPSTQSCKLLVFGLTCDGAIPLAPDLLASPSSSEPTKYLRKE